MGMEMEGHAPELAHAEAQSLGTVLTTGGLAKGAGEWLPVRLLIDLLGREHRKTISAPFNLVRWECEDAFWVTRAD